MRWLFLFVVLLQFPLAVKAQGGNQKPRIIGQVPLSTPEDQSLEIDMLYLRVVDPDDWFYPWGFTLNIYPGENYTVQGNIVIPASNFNGTITVTVTVHDGVNESDPFGLQVTVIPVNDRPVITGHATLSTRTGEPLTIRLDDLEVQDPDNAYPADFTLRILNGARYRVSGDQITPTGQFVGTLNVNVRVSDGQLESETYALPIEVLPFIRKPRIIGQNDLQTLEDEAIAISLSDLAVEDDDSNYPEDFSLQISEGNRYSVNGNTVMPDSNYYGRLVVPVRVSDGTNASDPFDLTINVIPQEDAPMIRELEPDALTVSPVASSPTLLSQTISVVEVDGDSIVSVDIGFVAGTYQLNADNLFYNDSSDTRISSSFNATTGILTLTGMASPARYTQALRSVYYEQLIPVTQGERTVYFVAHDGKTASQRVERTILFGTARVALDIPTAFTPNGDTANDTWKIVPLQREDAHAEAHIRVYNRHGMVVFEAIGFEHEWDGRYNGELLPADTYFYTIDLKLNVPEGFIRGSVTLLR